MKQDNRKVGFLAENLAVEALKKKGYEILEQNFSNKFGEIDIIANDKGILVFVEVKAKKGVDFGLPEEMINAYKLGKIKKMAEVYLNGKTLPCRIDVVAIILSETNELLSLNHYENVYL
ncbi:MAG: YraN family protein [Candidatus Daviesbacteria bacterium]|nr:YraN family protein [Candidatus Daviesbacteria bacterium]